MLHGIDALDETFQARFQQEALATARLEHPNIIHIYDYGHEGALTYMVMEYCPNGSLTDVLAQADQQGSVAVAGCGQLHLYQPQIGQGRAQRWDRRSRP